MLVLGTRSSVIPEVLLGVGVKELSRPPDDGVEVRKTEPLEARTVGRREGSEENVLRVAVYWKVDIVFVVEFKLFPPRALERAANTKDRML